MRFRLARALLVALPLAAASGRTAAAADYAEGLAAYDAGLYAEAAAIWSRLARSGDAAAMVSLAGLYDAGFGVPRDPRRALELYRRAAERGDPLARRILRERGVRE